MSNKTNDKTYVIRFVLRFMCFCTILYVYTYTDFVKLNNEMICLPACTLLCQVDEKQVISLYVVALLTRDLSSMFTEWCT